MRIDPVVRRALPVFDRAFRNRFTFVGSEAFKPECRLLPEREHCRGLLLDHLVEMFDRVGTALRDDFTATAFAFRLKKKPGSRDGSRAQLLPGSIAPVNRAITDEALQRVTGEGS